jgi:polyisoprenoid-binding protein YceI
MLFRVVIALLMSFGVQAADGRYRLQPAASTIVFHLRAIGFIQINGTAQAAGSIVVTGEFAGIDVTVDLGGLRMSRESYRDWALSAEFFDAAAHPQLRFVAAAVPLERLRHGGLIDGMLTVRGITRSVRFRLPADGCALAAAPCKVRAEGELSRREFGMKSRRMTLGDRIGVALDLQLVQVP